VILSFFDVFFLVVFVFGSAAALAFLAAGGSALADDFFDVFLLAGALFADDFLDVFFADLLNRQ
jgi:hypothetical protein